MADVRFTGRSDFERVKRDYLELARRTARVETENQKLSRAAQQQSRQFQQARQTQQQGLQQATQALGRMVGQYLSVGAAIREVTGFLRAMREEEEGAVSALERLEQVRGRLLSIARADDTGDRIPDFQRMVAQAEELSRRTGMPRDQAHQLVFAGRSEGFEEAIGALAAVHQVADQRTLATLAGQVPALFTREELSPEQALSMALRATEASRMDPEQMARSLPIAAAGGDVSGASAAETMAAMSVLAQVFASPNTAAQRLQRFGAQVAQDEELAGTGFLGAIEALQAMPEEERREFLGTSIQLNEAFERLSQNADAIARLMPRVEEEQRTRAALSELQASVVDPRAPFAAQARRRAAQAEREIAEERFADRRQQIDTIIDRGAAAMAEAGVDRLTRFMMRREVDIMDFLGAEPETIRRHFERQIDPQGDRLRSLLLGDPTPETEREERRRILEQFREQTDFSERQARPPADDQAMLRQQQIEQQQLAELRGIREQLSRQQGTRVVPRVSRAQQLAEAAIEPA